jgi:hypothetical protein
LKSEKVVREEDSVRRQGRGGGGERVLLHMQHTATMHTTINSVYHSKYSCVRTSCATPEGQTRPVPIAHTGSSEGKGRDK